MAKIIKIAGVALTPVEDLGAGGQGQAQKMVMKSDPTTDVVIKSMLKTQQALIRTKGLTEIYLSGLSPFIAGPILTDLHKGMIRHLSPYAPGKSLEDDRPRTFAENMEVAHHLVCQIAILEENHLFHGDYSPTNIKLTDKGTVYLIDTDNAGSTDNRLPPPEMAGQAIMMAPEIRKGATPTTESDRYGLGILCTMILLGHYPADGLANNPAERNKIMSQGLWPERQRPLQSGETPIESLGPDIPLLFDKSFSLTPTERPSADMWRRMLLNGLHNLYIHECGQAFVGEVSQTKCPWCQKPVRVPSQSITLRIEVKGCSARYKIEIMENTSIIIGRGNIGGLNLTVSARHLEIIRTNDKFCLTNLGRNGSRIWSQGVWTQFDRFELENKLLNRPVHVRLADSDLVLLVK